eukprot:670471-Pyramimonas_sp.AAC.1
MHRPRHVSKPLFIESVESLLTQQLPKLIGCPRQVGQTAVPSRIGLLRTYLGQPADALPVAGVLALLAVEVPAVDRLLDDHV